MVSEVDVQRRNFRGLNMSFSETEAYSACVDETACQKMVT
jgi:hypothetical protein